MTYALTVLRAQQHVVPAAQMLLSSEEAIPTLTHLAARAAQSPVPPAQLPAGAEYRLVPQAPPLCLQLRDNSRLKPGERYAGATGGTDGLPEAEVLFDLLERQALTQQLNARRDPRTRTRVDSQLTQVRDSAPD